MVMSFPLEILSLWWDIHGVLIIGLHKQEKIVAIQVPGGSKDQNIVSRGYGALINHLHGLVIGDGFLLVRSWDLKGVGM